MIAGLCCIAVQSTLSGSFLMVLLHHRQRLCRIDVANALPAGAVGCCRHMETTYDDGLSPRFTSLPGRSFSLIEHQRPHMCVCVWAPFFFYFSTPPPQIPPSLKWLRGSKQSISELQFVWDAERQSEWWQWSKTDGIKCNSFPHRYHWAVSV